MRAGEKHFLMSAIYLAQVASETSSSVLASFCSSLGCRPFATNGGRHDHHRNRSPLHKTRPRYKPTTLPEPEELAHRVKWLATEMDAVGSAMLTSTKGRNMTDKNTATLANHPEHHLGMAARWYMVNRDGAATLCVDREDAEKEAADAQRFWPHMGPHRAVRLVETSFEAADMATAAADGYRASAAEVAKLRGQRAVLCSLLGECLPEIDALMQVPGDDDSDAHLNGLMARVGDALDAIAEDQVKRGES